MEEKDLQIIKKTVEEFFLRANLKLLSVNATAGSSEHAKESVLLEVDLQEPQILIGQGGQTLFETQRLFKILLNKKTGRIFYVDLDINGYKKKKNDYLRRIADDIANEVAFTKKEKALSSMPAYERRVIHAELAKRTDVKTESTGEGERRHIIVKPAQD